MSKNDEPDQVAAAIAGLETQRAVLGDAVVDSAIHALREQAGREETAAGERADERKLVTILFSDISGFTALAVKEDPEKVRELINACFDQLVPVVQKYGGTVDKFIGDEIMALFGAPLAHEDDAERALRAALEMMTALADFNRSEGTSLGLHFGINTGTVVAGEIGAKNRRDYSVMGYAVNLAARLEEASETGEIFVGPTTYRLTSPLFDEAESLAREALNIWHGMEDPYSLDWMALWPLIALAWQRDDLAQAAEHVRALLAENQHPLAEEVMIACRAVIADSGVTETLRSRLHDALQSAREFHYL